ncbi:MAG: hypothetical protein LC124_14405 [Ignavibacteriales bacterium]|nr:hypothetical protein [Brumimicrobium sp.]MCZ2270038.1 hypothetical protein [Ignavibacteriales bacterium]
MELIFNELSIEPLAGNVYSANDRMIILAQAMGEARQKGFNIIRSHNFTNQIQLTDNYTIYDWLNNRQVSEIHRNLLYGMITPPFISEEDEEIEDQYLASNYYFEDTASNISKTECLGLASAYLYETLSISLNSLPVWEQPQLKIKIESGESEATAYVFNVFSRESFDQQVISDFVDEISEVELQETGLSPDEKNIHVANHHGIQELQLLCSQLKLSPYVIEMRSMEWCQGRCNNFIKKCHRDGVIEIVLYRTDRKYSLRVQSTGRNLRETKAIAEILRERYS